MELFRLIIIKPITSEGFDEIHGLEYYIYISVKKVLKKKEKNSAFHPGNLRIESKLTLLPARLLVRVSSGFREILFRRFIFISNRNAICFKPIYIYIYI